MTSPSNAPLPELQRATLDAATLTRLLADLAAHAELIAINARHRGRGERRALTIDEVEAALAEGSAVQIAYRFEGAAWIDTLTRDGEGTQLVRAPRPTGA